MSYLVGHVTRALVNNVTSHVLDLAADTDVLID